MESMKTIRKSQKGFTLIELLVTIGILGVLAAVVVPNVGRFVGAGATQAQATELKSVQTAMDTAMADLSLQAVTVVAAPGVSDFSAPAGAFSGTTTLYPNYLRFQKSGGASTTYSWDATGKVTQAGTWK